jgi:hypothetical protein
MTWDAEPRHFSSIVVLESMEVGEEMGERKASVKNIEEEKK